MFNTISWQGYWTAIAIITAGYYLFVYLVYFRRSVGMIFQKEADKNLYQPPSVKKENQQPSLFDPEQGYHLLSTEEELEHIVYACMDELNAFFDNQKRSKAVKREVIFGLQSILQKYPSLKNSDHRTSLTNVIATQCENICSIHLSAEELKGVWLGSE